MPTKTLLIHNDNVSYDDFIHSIKFTLLDGDIDNSISSNIISKINSVDVDVIFIKDNLSSNYIELLGLRVAYHIRFSNELDTKKNIPIVIISDLDYFELSKLSKLSNMLFTKNIFLIPNTKSAIENILKKEFKHLTKDEYEKNFLNLIEIEPPKDYLSHHSITNEWAIDQWAYFLNVQTKSVFKNREKISSMLYYKFLINQYHLTNLYQNTNVKPKKYKGKILLVDDKYKDGWADILESFCKMYYTNVEFNSFQKIDKDSTIGQITKDLLKTINEFDPNIILLDLRLLESDTIKVDTKQNINKLSGIEILSKIKNLYPAIQIIMFTASSDSLILDELYNKWIIGYIKKDSPNIKYQTSKNSFKKLDSLIRKSLEKKYLKNIFEIQQKIQNLSLFQNQKDNKILEILEIKNQVFDILNSNIPKSFLYAMYAIFKSIELINNFYFKEQNINGKWCAVWRESGKTITGYSTEDRILAILQKLQLEDEEMKKQLHYIVCSRNYNIHGGEEKSNCKDGLVKSPTELHIEIWFETLYKILNKMK